MHHVANQLIHIEELRHAYFGHEPETVHVTTVLVLKMCGQRYFISGVGDVKTCLLIRE